MQTAVRPPDVAHPSKQQARFGCRNLMVVSNQRMSLVQLFGPLIGWDNSFVEQSLERSNKLKSPQGKRYCLLKDNFGPANAHGFGVLAGAAPNRKKDATPLTTFKSEKAITHHWPLLTAFAKIAWARPTMFQAHLREKSDALPPSLNNTQPFEMTLAFKNGFLQTPSILRMHFLHNGAINGIKAPEVQQALADLPKLEPGLLPQKMSGTTDSEQLFRLMLVKLREVLKKSPQQQLQASDLNPTVLQQAIAKTILDVEALSHSFPHPDQKNFPGRMLTPGLNVMVTVDLPKTKTSPSSKRMMVVSRKGRGLYKTWLETPGKEGTKRRTLLVASEKMHPHGKKDLDWQPFADGETLTVVEDAKTGQTQGWQSTLQNLALGVPHRFDWVI